MAKALRSLTVIPPQLYVERDADRQLASIVSNMGRPGYVLVARQMGKTNLLLHAKRVLQTNGDVFVYLDVSNTFPDLRSFLRNIIEVASESTPDPDAMHAILSERQASNRLPHKEHEWELRLLLSKIAGRLVICLDEIDALTSSDYSDQAFSFVRSVYFSGRANFPEFERLTYLLSGVAEPADIIKNREVSPFNIGEKILLQDFSFAEFETLLGHARLQFSQLARDRIFWWTNGHPRMCWDLCSRLEDLILAGHEITPNVVDDTVRKLYFTEVAMPPVDHVKKLAEDSADIRDALISIHYGRGESLSEAIKTKLYLAGICRMTPQSASVSFKNKILEESLSEPFLRSLAATSLHDDAFALGKEAFYAAQYLSALAHFTAVRSAAEDVEDERRLGLSNHWLGRAHFALGQDEAAATAFAEARKFLSGEEGHLNAFYLGKASLAKGDVKLAIASFESIVDDEHSPRPLRSEAAVDLATTLLIANPQDRSGKAEALCIGICSSQSEVINTAGTERASGDTIALARHTLATIYLRKGRRSDAAGEIDEGLKLATPNIQLRLLLLRAEIVPSERDFLLTKCKAILLASKRFGFRPDAGEVSLRSCREVLSRLEAARRLPDAEDVVAHIFASAGDLSIGLIADELAAAAITGGNLAIGTAVLDQALLLSHKSLPTEEQRHLLLTLLSLSPEKSLKHANRFLSIAEEETGGVFASELFVVNNIVFYSSIAKNKTLADRALKLLALEPLDANSMTDSNKAAWRLLDDYLHVLASIYFNPDIESIDRARRLLWRTREFRSFDLSKFKPDFVASIRETLEHALREHGIESNLRRSRRIGRNEIVTVQYDEQLKHGKYKYFAADIEAGRCRLVDKLKD